MLESLLNTEKFVETHSLIEPETMAINNNSNFLRRSASHLDLVQAFDDHDHFVEELNEPRTVKEADFSAWKFERFDLKRCQNV